MLKLVCDTLYTCQERLNCASNKMPEQLLSLPPVFSLNPEGSRSLNKKSAIKMEMFIIIKTHKINKIAVSIYNN